MRVCVCVCVCGSRLHLCEHTPGLTPIPEDRYDEEVCVCVCVCVGRGHVCTCVSTQLA